MLGIFDTFYEKFFKLNITSTLCDGVCLCKSEGKISNVNIPYCEVTFKIMVW